MKIEENLTEFDMIWRFSSLPKFTYSILYVFEKQWGGTNNSAILLNLFHPNNIF